MIAQLILEPLRFRSVAMCGRAMFTAVMSRMTISCATSSTGRSQRFGVPVFKEWTGISRKYAIPLLEYLDRERVTRRVGDERVIL